MTDLHVIEVEPEVRSWLELLPGKQYRKVEEYAELLVALGTRTPMPFARPLRDGVYELRPTLAGEDTRITYWFGSQRRIVLLTVFRKTRMRETAQVARAVKARMVCEAEHGPAHMTYSRSEEGDAS
ncbi:type II toxin-antitoxin system RelE/ParE family toxin [Streptomyces sp. NPDC050529]|uniref:type II toxin-antitoxin system RelE/ParE family toxin n=1 Tax=unclassified Streptomyces TaxID=2593676 RepID=UPI002DDA54BC|nr:type II toxin-antitoxin system RelE/ParE family toxin [Streptomyces sp. NBC_01022]WRZ83440.1 type II toxin-antitoxin system RelE/ParE family toxin [Streptomyces sp. NBC_01022]